MASVQERLQMNRVTLDKWSTREQLCLASAVSSNGEQNWVTISRSLKVICGAHRPADWFSQKSCAVQYEQLLENVDTMKRKKRGASVAATGGSVTSPTVETPTDTILKCLTEERIQQLKVEIRQEQEEYAKIYNELKSVQSGQLSEQEIVAMWQDIEKEQAMQRIEEMKLENQLREREQNQQELQRNWRATETQVVNTTIVNNFAPPQHEQHQQHDMNVETEQQSQQPLATSPLLSSLLKSPTPTGVTTAPLTMTAHATAPTITTLLTGGAINQNQPAITLNSMIPASEAAHLLTRPISGPPTDGSNVMVTQQLLSPSQSSPTLSMLLEKNKIHSSINVTALAPTVVEQPTKAPVSLLSDSNNEEVPMDIEVEDVMADTVSAAELMTAVVDLDAEANEEEQQLLEVFKNIGNIDELALADIDVAAVIDEEVDFLKGVDEEDVDDDDDETAVAEDIFFDAKSDIGDNVEHSLESLNHNKEAPQQMLVNEMTAAIPNVESKIETISSDDSNDNVPLANLGTSAMQEHKELILINQNSNAEADDDTQFIDTEAVENMLPTVNAVAEEEPPADQTFNYNEELWPTDEANEIMVKNQSPSNAACDNYDVIIIPTDDESNGEKQQTAELSQNTAADNNNVEQDANNASKISEELLQCNASDTNTMDADSPIKELKDDARMMAPSQTISLADTDEDSSTTDVSSSTKRDEKILKTTLQQGKRYESMDNKLLEDEQTPAKPPSLRKLRERDRSESPLTAIDDDTTASDHSAMQRSRRRYSSTPIIDSIPNSPASSDRDEREGKTPRKSLLSIYNALLASKNAVALQRICNEQSPRFKQICKRSLDFQVIKKHIETSVIRSISDLQRDVLLFCQNAIMVFDTNSANYKIVCEFMLDCQNIKEFASSCHRTNSKTDKEYKELRSSISNTSSPYASGGVKVRGSARKSQRIT